MADPALGLLTAAVALGAVLTAWSPAAATVYYVAADGNDANAGESQRNPWRSLDRVNAADLKPGDQVLFKRGDTWRGQLRPHSGSEAGHVLYAAYGTGPKPTLLGSIPKDKPEQWVQEAGDIWATVQPLPTLGQVNVLPPDVLKRVGLHREQGAKATLQRTEEGLRIECGRSGRRSNHVQLMIAPLTIERGKTYLLRFRAKSTKPFGIPYPKLMQRLRPWTGYAVGYSGGSKRLSAEWTECAQFYTAALDADDARFNFPIGGSIPAGAVVELANFTMVECTGGDLLPCDVGNIILDHGKVCAVKKWEEDQIKADLDFWYDEQRHLVKIHSTDNPAKRFGSVEFALRKTIISESDRHHVIYENLALKYAGVHGVAGARTHHITVRDCDFSYIGGGDQYGGERTVRLGNGVEFWGDAHHNLVERCRFWEIYDAAVSPQNKGRDVEVHHIVFRHNLIWNCEYSFEYWNRPATSKTYHIYFEHNTCVNAGGGWGHSQRSNPAGRHLCFYSSPAQMSDFYVRNNIFYQATDWAFDALWWKPEQVASLHMDHNCWVQPQGTMIRIKGKNYTMAQFADYQRDIGIEPHSFTLDPKLADLANTDFHLTPGSPCVDAGMDLGYKADLDGKPVPNGNAPDMGAYELQQ